MVVFGFRKRWAWWHSPSPNWQYIPQYILPSGGLYATYHLLWEPETTIENLTKMMFFWKTGSSPVIFFEGPRNSRFHVIHFRRCKQCQPFTVGKT